MIIYENYPIYKLGISKEECRELYSFLFTYYCLVKSICSDPDSPINDQAKNYFLGTLKDVDYYVDYFKEMML